MKYAYALIGVGLMFATPVGATAFKSADDLFKICQHPEPQTAAASEAYCLAYITGVADSLLAVREMNHLRPCMVGVTAAQAKDVVMRYLQQYRQQYSEEARRSWSAAGLVTAAFGDTWCNR